MWGSGGSEGSSSCAGCGMGRQVGGPCRLIDPLRSVLSPFLGGDDLGRLLARLLASLQWPGPGLHLSVGQGVGRRGSR